MKNKNATHWSTADLRRIAARVAAQELSDSDRQAWQRRHLHVQIGYTRRAAVLCGRATLRGTWARLNVPREAVDPVRFAWLCAHEFSHTRGLVHARFPGWLMYFTDESAARYSWAAALPIRAKAVPAAPTAAATAARAHAHALQMFRKAQARQKRAATIARKWARRVRYYERKAAAASAPAAPRETAQPCAECSRSNGPHYRGPCTH